LGVCWQKQCLSDRRLSACQDQLAQKECTDLCPTLLYGQLDWLSPGQPSSKQEMIAGPD